MELVVPDARDQLDPGVTLGERDQVRLVAARGEGARGLIGDTPDAAARPVGALGSEHADSQCAPRLAREAKRPERGRSWRLRTSARPAVLTRVAAAGGLALGQAREETVMPVSVEFAGAPGALRRGAKFTRVPSDGGVDLRGRVSARAVAQ